MLGHSFITSTPQMTSYSRQYITKVLNTQHDCLMIKNSHVN